MHAESKQVYDADYYLRGQETGVSNYTNYSWRPELTLPFARRVVDVLGIQVGQSLLDFGCARGYLVKALRQLWIDAYGYDISQWAIENCDPAVTDYVSTKLSDSTFDFIVAKDVLEHLTFMELQGAMAVLAERLRDTMLIVVPLRQVFGTWVQDFPVKFVRDEDNVDKTHQLCWSLEEWIHNLDDMVPSRFAVSGSWRYPGIKPCCAKAPKSCGFLFVRRL